MRVFGFVQAGGGSTRFGADKALVELRGKTLLARTVEQLSKEGYVVDFKGQTRDFADLFVVAFLPVTNGRLAPDAEHGTLGLVVVFTKVPAPTTLVVSQVVRVDYAKNVYTKNFEINGKEETLKGSQLVTDEEHLMLQLVVDNEGEVRQKIDRLLTSRR